MIIVRHILLVVILLGLVLAPHIAGLVGVQARSIENRPLATLPKMTRSTVLNASYFQALGSYLRDNLPGRVEATLAYNWAVLRILRGSPAPNVFEGRNGELFLDVEFLSPCAANIPVKTLVDHIRSFSAGVEASGRKLFVTFAPNKSFVSPEKMSPVLTELAACPTARRNELRQLMQDAKDVRWIDLWAELDRFKATSKNQLFPQRGRHSTPLAGVIFSRGIINAVQPGLWNEASIIATAPERSQAELPRRFMGLNLAQYNTGYHVDRRLNAPPVRRVGKLTAGARRDSLFYTNASTNQPLIRGKTVVFHDSFMDLSQQSMSQYFADITFVHWADFMAMPDDVAKAISDSEYVIIEYVEDLKEESVPNTVGNSDVIRRILARVAELDKAKAAATIPQAPTSPPASPPK